MCDQSSASGVVKYEPKLSQHQRNQIKKNQQFDHIWSQIFPFIHKLLQQQPITPTEWQCLFSLIYKLYLRDDTGMEKIKKALKLEVLTYLKQIQQKILAHEDDQVKLDAYMKEYSLFFTSSNQIPAIFRRLNCINKPNYGSRITHSDNSYHNIIRLLLVECWVRDLFRNMHTELLDSAMKCVNLKRNGELVDCQMIIALKDSYVEFYPNHDDTLRMYREYYEREYIERTKSYYNIQAIHYFENNDILSYLDYVDDKLRKEIMYAEKYLDPSSIQILIDCCVEIFISKVLDTILAEYPIMINTNNIKNLKTLFTLMNYAPDGMALMLKNLEEYIVTGGLDNMIKSKNIIINDSVKYVETILMLFQKHAKLICEAFNNDKRFLFAQDEAFKRIINDTTVFQLEPHKNQKPVAMDQPELKCPELLANLCDMLLRKSYLNKKLTADEIDNKLKDAFIVLKYIGNKDVFMKYYKTHLARRLIMQTSIDNEKEKTLIIWLRKIGMREEYIFKPIKMLQDIQISADINQELKEKYTNHEKINSDALTIKVLNAGIWPLGKHDYNATLLPPELEDYKSKIEHFYKIKYSHRKLQWCYHLSNGIITFTNDIGQFDIDVTTFQMIILFVWNQRPKDKLSFKSLKLTIDLPEHELRKTLWSLVNLRKLKKQILFVTPEVSSPDEFNENTQFWINEQFSLNKTDLPKKKKLNHESITAQSITQNIDDNSLVQLRAKRLQEAIMMILKMRKQISFMELKAEIEDALKNIFLPDKQMIKDQIEWLIDQKSLKRDYTDINMLIYIP